MRQANRLRRNTTSKGCRPAFMAARENAANPANRAMEIVTQKMPAIGPLAGTRAVRFASSAGMRGDPPVPRVHAVAATVRSYSLGGGIWQARRSGFRFRFRVSGVTLAET